MTGVLNLKNNQETSETTVIIWVVLRWPLIQGEARIPKDM